MALVHRLATVALLALGVGCVYGLSDLALEDDDTEPDRPTPGTTTSEDSGGWVSFDTADTQSSGDTDDTETDTTPDTSTTPGTNKPVIETWTATEQSTDVRFDFKVVDPDGDMEGGWATIEVGATSQTYRWSADLDMTSNVKGSTTWLLEDFTPEDTVTVKLKVEDITARKDSASLSFTRATPLYTASEIGDDLNSVVDLGQIAVPSEINGTIWGCGNAGGGYSADSDMVRFTVADTREYQLALSWSDGGVSDLDLYLLSNSNSELDRSTTIFHPEKIRYTLSAGTNYRVFVGCWSGTSGSWTVRITAP